MCPLEVMTMITEEEAKKLLEEFGIKEAKVGDSGSFDVTPGEFKIYSVESIDEEHRISVDPSHILYVTPNILPPAFCIFGFEPWCWVRKYKDPEIDFDIFAYKVKDVNVYLLKGEIHGKIVTRFFNKSKEGETWEENVKTGEKRNHEKVEGSADLEGDFKEEILMKKIDEVLAKVSNAISKIKPKVKIKIESSFRKKGYINMIKTILKYLLTGTIYVDDDIEVTVYWTWLGKRHKLTRKVHVSSDLPVENVNWHLW